MMMKQRSQMQHHSLWLQNSEETIKELAVTEDQVKNTSGASDNSEEDV